MVEYLFYSTSGNGGSTVEFDVGKIREYYFDGCLSDALIEYAVNEGESWDDISKNAKDFDPYETEISVSAEEYERLKAEFPDAYEPDWEFIKIK